MRYGIRLTLQRLLEIAILYVPGAAIIPGTLFLFFFISTVYAVIFFALCALIIGAAFPILKMTARRLDVPIDL